jgi:hypothetical protein
MKKFSYLLIAAAMTLGFSACSKTDNPSNPTVGPTEGKVIIKEVNVGGSKVGTKSYNNCKAIILYNNGGKAVTLSNFGFGVVNPANGHAASNPDLVDGKLVYEDLGFHPALYGIWYFPGTITIEPYSDLVVAVNGAIDHTVMTNGANAFDLTNADIAMYDPEGVYNNATVYPQPTKVPADKWMKGIRFNTTGNSWPISTSSPAIILFQVPEGTDPAQYFTNEDNIWYPGGTRNSNGSNTCYKVPNEWITDAVELFQADKIATSNKRLVKSIDAGYGLYMSTKCYSAYRNVDEPATVNLPDNLNKLVYNYDQGVEGTTDPSGIDAAASIKNGAKIVYLDTNNSTNDFHLRKDWSLK